MPVTKQTYTATVTWTMAQYADLFRQAFIDAGLMTDWFDSYTSGTTLGRVLRIVYDGTKTYGTTYYVFRFYSNFTTGIEVTSGWNTSTKIGSGTRYLDYFALDNTTTNTPGFNLITTSSGSATANNISITRYTSQVDSSFSWFVLKTGTTVRPFVITPASHTRASWLDLDKGYFNHFLTVTPSISTAAGQVVFSIRGSSRRAIIGGSGLLVNTDFTAGYINTMVIGSPGRNTTNNTNNSMSGAGYTLGSLPSSTGTALIVPNFTSAGNPAYTQNYNPVYTGMPYSIYISNAIPSDLGVCFHYDNNTMVAGDKFIVSAGVEEWEITSVANSGELTTGASAALVARVV